MTESNLGFGFRKRILFYILVGFFCIFVFQLFQMQIVNTSVYDEKSAENSIKGIVQTPLRGVFYDRNMKVMVNNKPSYTVLITPSNYNRKLDRVLETVLDVEPGYVNKVLSLNSIYSKYIPIRIQRDVSFNVVSWIEENSDQLPGVSYMVELERKYEDSIKGSHMFGYTKEVSRLQLEQDKYYSMGDFIGHSGIEKNL